MTVYDKLVKLGHEKYQLKIGFKDESRFMRTLGKLMFFNPAFMQRFTTTIGSTVYFPTRAWVSANTDAAARVLAHELVHIADAKKMTSKLFSMCYLSPQIFAIFSLLAIFGSCWWLVCLLFLLPLPSPARTFLELRGYAMTDAVTHKQTNGNAFAPIEFLRRQFTSGAYYFMWPFASDVENRISKNRELILAGKLSEKIGCANDVLTCFEIDK